MPRRSLGDTAMVPQPRTELAVLQLALSFDQHLTACYRMFNAAFYRERSRLMLGFDPVRQISQRVRAVNIFGHFHLHYSLSPPPVAPDGESLS